jgi:hypothetical protein
VPSTQDSSGNSQNVSATLAKALRQTEIFWRVFIREGDRAELGYSHQLPRASAQLRACLDLVDAAIRRGEC